MASGDWSAVEKREEVQRRLNRIGSENCPAGRLEVCVGPETDVDCKCVKGY